MCTLVVRCRVKSAWKQAADSGVRRYRDPENIGIVTGKAQTIQSRIAGAVEVPSGRFNTIRTRPAVSSKHAPVSRRATDDRAVQMMGEQPHFSPTIRIPHGSFKGFRVPTRSR